MRWFDRRLAREQARRHQRKQLHQALQKREDHPLVVLFRPWDLARDRGTVARGRGPGCDHPRCGLGNRQKTVGDPCQNAVARRFAEVLHCYQASLAVIGWAPKKYYIGFRARGRASAQA